MIQASAVSRRFGALVAVDRLSLSVPAGTVLALLGPNGAGKTTTVRILAGLLAPTEGSAMVAGHDVGRDPAAVRARVGLVTDVPGLHEQMTAPAYLDFFGNLYGLQRAERTRRVADLLAFFDLLDHRKERMVGFSKGMKQKVALARALLHDPAALFLDEPTSGLDPLAARAVRELIVELKHASRAIVLCTHDLDEAERLADQVAILQHGRIVACDTPAALRATGSPQVTVRVALAAPCSAALASVSGLDGLSAPQWVTAEGAGDAAPVLEYRTRRPAEVNPTALELLIQAGARVVSVTCTARTLEDAYAEVIGGPGENGGDGVRAERTPVAAW